MHWKSISRRSGWSWSINRNFRIICSKRRRWWQRLKLLGPNYSMSENILTDSLLDGSRSMSLDGNRRATSIGEPCEIKIGARLCRSCGAD